MGRQHDLDLPEGWTVDEYLLTGHFKLIARFTHSPTGAVLNVVPYKTYRQPGFTNAHRVTLTRDGEVEVIAEGLEIEHSEEAEEVAVEAMKELSEKD